MLVRCLYASRAASPIDASTLDAILRKSRENNTPRGITGLLCIAADVFIQVIEGGRAPVNELIKSIFADDRHRDVHLLVYEEISERRFHDWAMGQVNMNKINPAMLLKYSEKAEINPFDSSGSTTMALINELLATGAIVNRAN